MNAKLRYESANVFKLAVTADTTLNTGSVINYNILNTDIADNNIITLL